MKRLNNDFAAKIKVIESLSNEEKAYLINLVNRKRRYGLIWDDKFEDVEEQLSTMLPVLHMVEEKTISQGTCKPNHSIIEGDNLHALTALSFTHEGKVDIIYIDPPYNTGNKDFKYNDSFVDKEDTYRHSKWLSFISKRIALARRLLKKEGIIFISIDDNELFQLKLLMDQEFGERNFISNIIWAAGKKNDSKYISNSHEYILAYFKDIDTIKEKRIVWRERKEGIDKIYKTAAELVKKHDANYELATVDLKTWFKKLAENDPAKQHSHYSVIDEKGVYFPDNISWPGGGGPTYTVLHPETGRPVVVPSRGWVYSTPQRMQEVIAQGKVLFGRDETSVPTLKSYLRDREYQVPYSVLYKDGRAATKRLREIFGKDMFDNPKDETIISRLLNLPNNKSATILDFFAGSGTTLHATMQLNAEDGGNRQCILVTNNENNICEEVTYERNKRVIQGYTTAKGVQVSGLAANNLRYYRTGFVPSVKTEQNKRLLTRAATELLCIKEDCYEDVSKTYGLNAKQATLFSNGKGRFLLVVYHGRQQAAIIEQLIDLIPTLPTQQKVRLYGFSPEKDTLSEDFAAVANKVEAVPLPEAIYNAYRATFRAIRLDRKGIVRDDNAVHQAQGSTGQLFAQNGAV